MNVIEFGGKKYKEFELPEAGMFFNKNTFGLAWNDGNSTIYRVILEAIYPSFYTGDYRVKTSNSIWNNAVMFQHCALFNDTVIDSIRNPTVEDVKRGCFVKVIESNIKILNGFVFLANKMNETLLSIKDNVICNEFLIPLNQLEFLCYADESNVFKKKTNMPAFLTVEDIQKHGIEKGDQIELYNAAELFALHNFSKIEDIQNYPTTNDGNLYTLKNMGELLYQADSTTFRFTYIEQSQLDYMGNKYIFDEFSNRHVYVNIKINGKLELIPAWCIKRIIKMNSKNNIDNFKTKIFSPFRFKADLLSVISKIKDDITIKIETFSKDELKQLDGLIFQNYNGIKFYSIGSFEYLYKNELNEILGKQFILNKNKINDGFIFNSGFKIPYWCIKQIIF